MGAATSRSRRKSRPEVQSLEPRILLSAQPPSSSRDKAAAATIPSRATSHPQLSSIKPATIKKARARLEGQTAYLVPGLPGSTINATFTLTKRDTRLHDEFGLFLVDDPSGRIGKLRPGDHGYTAAALKRRQVVFARSQKAGAKISLQLPTGRYFGT
jgi:hypothetical protein